MVSPLKFESRNDLMDEIKKESKTINITFTKEFQERGSIMKRVKLKKADSTINSACNKNEINPKYTSPLLCFRSYRYYSHFFGL